MRIALIDDNAALLAALSLFLAVRGYAVEPLQEPVELVEMVKADPNRFDLIVTDYRMPELSGIELVTELRTLRPDLPAIVVSSFVDRTLLREAEQVGVFEVIAKSSRTALDVYAALERFVASTRADS